MTKYYKAVCLILVSTMCSTLSYSQSQGKPNDSILLNPTGKPYLLRSFLNFENKKRTHVISVGNPNHVNYSYDLKQGALLQIWKGNFMDMKEMWKDRGNSQVAKPNGTVVLLSGSPALALLDSPDAVWPDLLAFDDLDNKGYVLDHDRNPSFKYFLNGADVTDKISVPEDGKSIKREINIKSTPANFYCRIAAANVIESAGKDLYVIGNKSYSIRIDKRYKPVIRKTQHGQELICGLNKGAASLTYSIIW